jgi:hypothetical protein
LKRNPEFSKQKQKTIVVGGANDHWQHPASTTLKNLAEICREKDPCLFRIILWIFKEYFIELKTHLYSKLN